MFRLRAELSERVRVRDHLCVHIEVRAEARDIVEEGKQREEDDRRLRRLVVRPIHVLKIHALVERAEVRVQHRANVGNRADGDGVGDTDLASAPTP